jgi:CubicO group peptidase (beta-lactamase class C family)
MGTCDGGLGKMINLGPVENGRKAASLAWAGLYNTHYWIDPASGIARVIMMQVLPFADERAKRLSAVRARHLSVSQTRLSIAANRARRPARAQFTYTRRARPL